MSSPSPAADPRRHGAALYFYLGEHTAAAVSYAAPKGESIAKDDGERRTGFYVDRVLPVKENLQSSTSIASSLRNKRK